MSTQTDPTVRVPASLVSASNSAQEYAQAARSKNTKRAYRASWRDFEDWCEQVGIVALPATPETVAMYLSARALQLKVGTLGHRLAAIAVAHKVAGYPNPTSKREEPLASIWAGIKRKRGQRKTQKMPLLEAHLRKIIKLKDAETHSAIGELRWIRDRALLLVGFAGALRRSELVDIDIKDLTFDERGLRLYIPRSKTDVGGEGVEIGIPATGTATCPVRAVKEWMEAAGLDEGKVFRAVRHGGIITESLSTRVVANLVKRYAGDIGLDPGGFSGHSLRSGLITQAATNGAREVDIMRHSRHKSVPVLRQYVRKATVWEDNAAAKALG